MDTEEATTLSLEFSADELWFLMSHFGPASVIGMDNPYLGFLANEIDEANRKAVKSLIERDITRPLTEDSLEVNEVVAALVQVCIHPEHTLIVQSQADQDGKQRFVHFSHDLIVEHVESKQDRHQLTAIRDKDALLEHLHDDLRSSSNTSSATEPFPIAEEALFKASSLFSEGKNKAASNVIVDTGLGSDIQHKLKNALTNPVANTVFVIAANQNNGETQHVRGLAILEGEDDIWLLRPFESNGQQMVEFTPANAEIVRERFLEILP